MHFYHLSGEAYFLYKSEHTDKVHWLTVKAASATDTHTQIGDASHSDCVPASTFTSRPTLQSHHFFFKTPLALCRYTVHLQYTV